MNTHKVLIGDVPIGGGAPVAVQTMWKDPLTHNLQPVVEQLLRLKQVGCAFVRFAVPNEDAAQLLIELAHKSPLPLVADIHYDYRLALQCIHGGIDKIRINPGNIGARWKVDEVIKAAAATMVPIRIGVNSGSLPKALRQERDIPQAMVTAAELEMEAFQQLNYESIVFSLKASDINTTVRANELFAEKYPYPLHLGVTEAGPLIPGIVKSSVAMVKLLEKGIGDTLRVSLSDTPMNEVITGIEILGAAGMGMNRPTIISCPRCGRATFDTHSFVEKLAPVLYGLEKNITVAIMGCVVNGPGEARHADLGITGAGKEIILFKNGEILRKVKEEEAFETFVEELEKL